MLDNFPEFSTKIHATYEQMSQGELYVVDLPDIFEIYLTAFPSGTNPLFRERTQHDCNCCKQFIRRVGIVVSIEDGKRKSIWDTPGLPSPYDVVAKILSEHIKQQPIRSLFRTKERVYSTPFNRDNYDTSIQWNHLYARIANRHFTATPEAARGQADGDIQVYRRGLNELKPEAIQTVLDLIADNAIYRGKEFESSVLNFYRLQTGYYDATDEEAYIWSTYLHGAARIRNTAVGTLLVNLSDGMEIEEAVNKYEKTVAPENYKRTSSVVTKRMIEDAGKALQSLGLEGAIKRRFAKITDVDINDVIFVDNSVQELLKGGTVLSDLLADVAKPQVKKIENPTVVSADEFFEAILPGAKSVDLLVENRHLPNFVSLTAPAEENTGNLFKWNNDFAWSYDGEVTDSIKQRVKKAGGNIDAQMRVSLAWFNRDDLDLHVHEPNGRHVYYHNKCGILDVDMNAGIGHTREPVENLAWEHLKDGRYNIQVHQFTRRETADIGFTLEVENAGRIHQYSYDRGVSGWIDCLAIHVKDRVITDIHVLDDKLKGGSQPTQKWGVTTETLVRVDTIMTSPNYWGGNGTGNLHYFFILQGCKNPEPVRGIYNEFLKGSLTPHRKVFEILGSKTKCQPSDEQLSGVGFSSTKHDVVKAIVQRDDGTRAYEIVF
jgi:desulfoferrodoxin (superoxide reductase-like protein)